MYVDHHEAARQLGISDAEMEELIQEGIVLASRVDDKWVIEERTIKQLQAKYGAKDPKEFLRHIKRNEALKGQQSFGFSRIMLEVLRVFAWLILIVSIIGTVLFLAQRDNGMAILSGIGALLSLSYIIAYDLMQAVFSINATLQRLALDVEEIRDHWRC